MTVVVVCSSGRGESSVTVTLGVGSLRDSVDSVV